MTNQQQGAGRSRETPRPTPAPSPAPSPTPVRSAFSSIEVRDGFGPEGVATTELAAISALVDRADRVPTARALPNGSGRRSCDIVPGEDYAAPGFSRDVAIFVIDPATGRGFATNSLTHDSAALAAAITSKLGQGPKYAVMVSESPLRESAERLGALCGGLSGVALQICDSATHNNVVYDGTRREIIVGYGHGKGENYFIGTFAVPK